MKPGPFLRTACLLAICAWVLYSQTARYEFVHYDDVRILLQHPERYARSTLAGTFRAIVFSDFPREEPLILRDLNWALDSALFGFGNAWAYHAGNIFLHGIVVALLYCVLLQTTGRNTFSLMTTCMYLVLAVHVEPVAWIMGRKDILSALFMLLAFYAQARRLQADARVRKAVWYGVTFLCVAAGLFSKISVLSFPLALFFHAVFYPYLHGDRHPAEPILWRPVICKEVPLFLPPMLLALSVFYWYRGILASIGIFDRGYEATGIAHVLNLLRMNPVVWLVYVRQIFFPTNLSVLYTWPVLQDVSLWFSASLCLLLAGMGVWLYRRRKDLFFYGLTFFVIMVPYMNIQYIGIWVADRYVYLGAFCLVAIAVDVVQRCARSTTWLRLPLLALLFFSAGWNLTQNLLYQPAWRNGETLWRYHVSLPAPSLVAFENLAAYYYREFTQASSVDARRLYLQKMETVLDSAFDRYGALESKSFLYPGLWYTYFLRAILHEVQGRTQEALNDWTLSARLRPGFETTHLNLSNLYSRLAGEQEDQERQREYAEAALDHYRLYLAAAYRGRSVPPEAVARLTHLQAVVAFGNVKTVVDMDSNAPAELPQTQSDEKVEAGLYHDSW